MRLLLDFNEEGNAEAKGHLKETGVTVVKPSQCKIESKDGVVGQITTEPLKLTPSYMIGTTDYVKFEPASGTTIDTFKLIKGSASCPIAGTYSTTGTLFGQSTNATNTFAVNRTIVLSGEVNKEAGGEALLGAKVAKVNGTASFILSGSKRGTAFSTH